MNRLCLFLFLPLLFSFTFNPMSQSIELGENQKSAQFFVENDSSEKMAIELSVKERRMDENGKEELPATSEITIFPPQMIIPPKEKRTIRVNWTGGKTVSSERSFRVIAEQLPLKVDEKTKKRSGIQMLMKYMAALYVTPGNAEPKIKILSVTKKGNVLNLLLENEGNKHQVMTKPVLSFGKNKVFKSDELIGLTGENLLAKSKRLFLIQNFKSEIPQGNAELKVEK